MAQLRDFSVSSAFGTHEIRLRWSNCGGKVLLLPPTHIGPHRKRAWTVFYKAHTRLGMIIATAASPIRVAILAKLLELAIVPPGTRLEFAGSKSK
jgi:hypothetical protein